jgi:hypothetical protein
MARLTSAALVESIVEQFSAIDLAADASLPAPASQGRARRARRAAMGLTDFLNSAG